MGNDIIPLVTMYGEAAGLQHFLDALALMHKDYVGDECLAMSEAAGSIAAYFHAKICEGVKDADE